MRFPPNDEAIRLLEALGFPREYNDALHAYFTAKGLPGSLADQFAAATDDMWPPSLVDYLDTWAEGVWAAGVWATDVWNGII